MQFEEGSGHIGLFAVLIFMAYYSFSLAGSTGHFGDISGIMLIIMLLKLGKTIHYKRRL